MANRAYLAVSNQETIYPSFAGAGFRPERQLVATQAEVIPLLWLALFREGDLRRQVFHLDGREIHALAPLCRREKALGQLREAIGLLDQIFPALGTLGEYGAMLASALEKVDFAYVTLEVEEIGGLYPQEHRFDEILTLALRGFDRPGEIRFSCPNVTMAGVEEEASLDLAALGDIPPEIRKALERLQVPKSGGEGKTVEIQGFTANSHVDLLRRLAGFQGGRPLPSVRMFLEDREYSPEELNDHNRLLGVGKVGSFGYGMEVPWEKSISELRNQWKIG